MSSPSYLFEDEQKTTSAMLRSLRSKNLPFFVESESASESKKNDPNGTKIFQSSNYEEDV